MWKKKTIILGGGVNAYDAYQALMSEKNLGYDIQYLYTVNGKVEPISEDIKLLTEKRKISTKLKILETSNLSLHLMMVTINN